MFQSVCVCFHCLCFLLSVVRIVCFVLFCFVIYYCLSIYLFIYLFIYFSTYLFLPTHLCIFFSIIVFFIFLLFRDALHISISFLFLHYLILYTLIPNFTLKILQSSFIQRLAPHFLTIKGDLILFT